MTNNATGSCLCGAVKYNVTGPLRPVVACHCGQCQKSSGHYVAATSANKDDFELLQEQSLKWFFHPQESGVGSALNVVETYSGTTHNYPVFLFLQAP